MTETWIGLLLFTISLTIQADKEFATEKECWDWYNIPSNYQKIGTPVSTHHFKLNHLNYPIRLYKDSNSHLIWLTCESSDHMKGNDISGKDYPLNILLPTPT